MPIDESGAPSPVSIYSPRVHDLVPRRGVDRPRGKPHHQRVHPLYVLLVKVGSGLKVVRGKGSSLAGSAFDPHSNASRITPIVNPFTDAKSLSMRFARSNAVRSGDAT